MIVPVAVPEPDCGVTLVVRVTLVPAVICAAEAESAELVLIFAGAETVSEIVEEADAAKVASPE
jgi:hypothetical protein